MSADDDRAERRGQMLDDIARARERALDASSARTHTRAPLRATRTCRARRTSACSRCGDMILVGHQIGKVGRRWLHVGCIVGTVRPASEDDDHGR